LKSQGNMKKMATDIDPLYANSCGKIFTDHIVFASSNKESGYALNTIKTLRFTKRYATGSIVFSFLPGILLLVPYFLGKEDKLTKVMFISIGLIGVVVSLLKAKANYTLNVITTSGRKNSISVWEGNKNDAQKFTDKANALILKYKMDAAPKPGYNAGLHMAESISTE
jgi:hypothetical protein